MCNHSVCLCIHFISCRTESGDVLMSIIALIIAIIVALGVGACGDFLCWPCFPSIKMSARNVIIAVQDVRKGMSPKNQCNAFKKSVFVAEGLQIII